jgi:hypothetical protein
MLDVVVEAEDACPVVEGGLRVALIECLVFILGFVMFWVMESLESNEVWGMHSCMESNDRQKDQAGPVYFIVFLSFLYKSRESSRGVKFLFLLYYLNAYLQWNWHIYVGLPCKLFSVTALLRALLQRMTSTRIDP